MYSEETVKACTHATAKRTIRFTDGSIHEEGKDVEFRRKLDLVYRKRNQNV